MNQQLIKEIYERHVDMVYRVCYSYVKNSEDAKDAVQNTFVRLMKKDKIFESFEHEKAWLIVTAGNVCKDLLKSGWYKKTVSFEENVSEDFVYMNDDRKELLSQILQLPEKIRISIYLHYYEGYSSQEIGKMLNKGDGTVRGYLVKGRKILKERMGEL